MRVLITGGRDFIDERFINETLNVIHSTTPIKTLVHGGARGVDSLGGKWARANNVIEERHDADWKKHGNAAGPIRNTLMVNTMPDLVVAFPGGAGTAHCKRTAIKKGLNVVEPIYPTQNENTVQKIDTNSQAEFKF